MHQKPRLPSAKRIGTAIGLAVALGLAAIFGVPLEGPAPQAEQRAAAKGDFDYYVLVLSWSPTYCAVEGRARGEAQCTSRRPHGFILHGLWPQHNRGWPSFCAEGKRPWIPQDVIDGMQDIMPSKGLIIHQYKKHGTCAGLPPKGFFRLSRTLFESINIPGGFENPRSSMRTNPDRIEAAFLASNPGMTRDMISIVCGRGKRLREVRICFSRSGKLKACGINEHQDKLCRSSRIVVPPVE